MLSSSLSSSCAVAYISIQGSSEEDKAYISIQGSPGADRPCGRPAWPEETLVGGGRGHDLARRMYVYKECERLLGTVPFGPLLPHRLHVQRWAPHGHHVRPPITQY